MLAMTWALAPAAAFAHHGLIVVMYHRFGEERYPSTNVRLAQFDQHIAALQERGVPVVDLASAVAQIKAGEDLPEGAVAITVDDAYASVYEHAAPRLKEAGFPWTLFVASEPLDQGLNGYMTWDQVRALSAEGITIGAHSHAHAHMADMTEEEVAADFFAMQASFQQELGHLPALFTYPFGEAGPAVMAAAEDLGMQAAFGQHSGVVSRAGPLFYLPRFPINERFGTPDRFELVTNTKAVLARVDRSMIGVFDRVPKTVTLRPSTPGQLPNLSCFSGSGAALETNAQNGELEIMMPAPETTGRQRFNCTAPAGGGQFFWIGHQYLVR